MLWAKRAASARLVNRISEQANVLLGSPESQASSINETVQVFRKNVGSLALAGSMEGNLSVQNGTPDSPWRSIITYAMGGVFANRYVYIGHEGDKPPAQIKVVEQPGTSGISAQVPLTKLEAHQVLQDLTAIAGQAVQSSDEQ